MNRDSELGVGSIAVVGATGFVGSNLVASLYNRNVAVYEFNSRSLSSDWGQRHYDLALVAAPGALKWWANLNPEADLAQIEDLLRRIRLIKADRVVLYSTVDVFPCLNGVDETVDCAAQLEPYGANRHVLERRVRELFEWVTVVRLPGLFGPGIKKNVLYDLVNHHMLDSISPKSTYQWYPLKRLWSDTQLVLRAGLELVVLATGPLTNAQVVRTAFPELETRLPRFWSRESGDFVSYNIHSRETALWNESPSPYMMSSTEVLDEIVRWAASCVKPR